MFNVMQDDDFRKSLFAQLSKVTDNGLYYFPERFPILHRYTKLADYLVKDIIEEKIPVTDIWEFNDIFDGVMHVHKSPSDEEKKNREIIEFANKLGLPFSKESIDKFIDDQKELTLRKEMIGSQLLHDLGIYVSCFSSNNDSILMWSHYADSNKGLCISYDFNKLTEDDLFRSLLFPVAYADNPIIIPDVLKNNDVTRNAVETNIISTALTKYKIWKYENEWRLIFPFKRDYNEVCRRLSLKVKIKPAAICFGYHFLKSFFYFNDDSEEKAAIQKQLSIFNELIVYMIDNNIQAYIAIPNIGGYTLQPRKIDAVELKKLIEEDFKNSYPKPIRLYNVFLSMLNRLTEKEYNTNV